MKSESVSENDSSELASVDDHEVDDLVCKLSELIQLLEAES